MRAQRIWLAVGIAVAGAVIATGLTVAARSTRADRSDCPAAADDGLATLVLPPAAARHLNDGATCTRTRATDSPATSQAATPTLLPTSAPPPQTSTTPSARPSSSRPQPAATAPTATFAVGRRGNYTFSRAGRTLITRIWYPAASGAPGSVTADAPIASGRYPVILFSHGWGGVPETYLSEIVPLAAAGFIVAAPEYPTTASGRQTNLQDAINGNQSLDASEVISRVLVFATTAGNPFYQHVETSHGVGAAGHSLGGFTTAGLIGLKRDARVSAVVILAGAAVGSPSGAPVKVLFIHGDQDPTVSYASGRAAYAAISWPKAFLTHVGQGHDSWVWGNGATYPQTRNTMLDWMRWGLYGDAAAKRRLAGDASAAGTKWETSGL